MLRASTQSDFYFPYSSEVLLRNLKLLLNRTDKDDLEIVLKSKDSLMSEPWSSGYVKCNGEVIFRWSNYNDYKKIWNLIKHLGRIKH